MKHIRMLGNVFPSERSMTRYDPVLQFVMVEEQYRTVYSELITLKFLTTFF